MWWTMLHFKIELAQLDGRDTQTVKFSPPGHFGRFICTINEPGHDPIYQHFNSCKCLSKFTINDPLYTVHAYLGKTFSTSNSRSCFKRIGFKPSLQRNSTVSPAAAASLTQSRNSSFYSPQFPPLWFIRRDPFRNLRNPVQKNRIAASVKKNNRQACEKLFSINAKLAQHDSHDPPKIRFSTRRFQSNWQDLLAPPMSVGMPWCLRGSC